MVHLSPSPSLDRIGHVLASVQARAGPQGTTLLDTLLQFGQALPINNGVVQTNAILTAGDNDEQTRDYEMLASRSVLHEIRDNVPDKSLRYFALTRGAVELIRLWDPRRILSHLEENHQAVDWQYFAAKPGPDSCVSSVILEHKVSTHESNEIEKTAWQCASMQSDFGE